jgi:hypothetical protein
MPRSWILGFGAMVALFVGCDNDGAGALGSGGAGGTAASGGTGTAGTGGGDGTLGRRGCDPLTPTYCAFPYPNDYWTIADATTVTGIRLALSEEIMPENTGGVRSTPDRFNEADGFSAGIAAMTHMPGATTTGLPTPDTIADSLRPDSPTVILDAQTGERLAHWAELDAYVVEAKIRSDADAAPGFTIPREPAALEQERALMLRPAIRPDDATRYIVAIRNVVDGNGEALQPSPAFQALRDDMPSEDPTVEARRAHFEDIFQRLERAGIDRGELQLAWDFTTASRQNNTEWMVHMRDDALAKFPDGVPYSVEVSNEDLAEGIACRLEIKFDIPLYTTDGEAGALLNFGADGLPEQNGSYEYSAAMIIPEQAQRSPAALVAFGHGFLGAKEQVLGFQQMAASINLATFALDWKGFAHDDLATVASVILSGDYSRWAAIPERSHQGMLNFLMAMRTLSREAEGGPQTPLNDTLVESCGGAMIDGGERYYFGGSQGGILGAVLMALSTDIERGLLAVPGQSYNLLFNRSVVFDPFAPNVYAAYEWNALDVQMVLALIQGLWDRSEPNGYSKYIRTDLLPGTPPHEVMIQVSKGDHQVSNFGAHIMARSIGGVVNLAPTIRNVWGIPELSGPHQGSGMLEIDFGNPENPLLNIPPWDDTMPDPHGRATELTHIDRALNDFYRFGTVQNPCNGPCDLDDL